ncbi:MAG: XrtN system VIT domain-containing protein, partial [Bacteroidota bacterium]
KEIVVSSTDTWGDQEAVYSFYLPEGGVATSLSLWIEGVEQPARLTTKGKADSAYVEIVGVERRDPALMHWQEGNRLSVTVFPVPAGKSRRFKIGISVPLSGKEGVLHLGEIPFDGPDVSEVYAETQLSWGEARPADLEVPFSWYESDDMIGYQGSYVPNWRVSFEASELADGVFSFGEHSYQLQPTPWQQEDFVAKEIILDLNAAWNWWEVESVWEQVQDHPVYAYVPGRVRVTEKNLWAVFQSCKDWQFSLIPLHRFPNPAQTLVVSHSPEQSPLLSDLEGSQYALNLQTYLSELPSPVRWYHLDREVSPLLRSLKELRLVSFAAGSVEKLGQLLEQEQFPVVPESPDLIQVPGTDFSIRRSATAEAVVEAPDHVMRFFTYQQLLRDIGPLYFEKEAMEDRWLRQAEEGFVVSPVSSLVVLESQVDYERFGIEENEGTLGNATFSGNGSVPEPHEWLLIGLIALVVIGTFTKQRLGL